MSEIEDRQYAMGFLAAANLARFPEEFEILRNAAEKMVNQPEQSEIPSRLSFGSGELYVMTGKYEYQPAVFIAKAVKPGPVGTNNPEEDGDLHSLKPGEYVLTFPTEAQAKSVADALCTTA